MKTNRILIQWLTAAMIAVQGADEARASFVDYNIVNSQADLKTFQGSLDAQQINNGGGFLAGGIQISKASGGAGLPDSYTTVCTDLGGALYLGQTYSYDAPLKFTGQQGVNPNWGVNPDDASLAIQNAAYVYYSHRSVFAGSDVSAMAGLQLAVWEALYNTGDAGTVTGSRFQVSGGDAAAIADANSFLAGLDGSYNYQGYLLYPDPVYQNNANGEPVQELLIGAGDFTPVPEASTLIAGLFLLGISARTLGCRRTA